VTGLRTAKDANATSYFTSYNNVPLSPPLASRILYKTSLTIHTDPVNNRKGTRDWMPQEVRK